MKKRFIVLPQIPLKTLVYKKSDEDNSDDAWKTYNNLVVDFLFVLKDYKTCRTEPVAVLEYNGGGHYGTDPEQEQKVKENDQIKEIVVRKLGLKFYVLEGKSVCQENSYYIDKEVLRGRIQDLALKLENLPATFSGFITNPCWRYSKDVRLAIKRQHAFMLVLEIFKCPCFFAYLSL
nr:DUF2726 domain-containing protein [Helicobacter suis]